MSLSEALIFHKTARRQRQLSLSSPRTGRVISLAYLPQRPSPSLLIDSPGHRLFFYWQRRARKRRARSRLFFILLTARPLESEGEGEVP